jgi:Zn-dependent peptidase ImmA (M78 family)
MFAETPHEEFAAALDACADDLLWEAAVDEPPVDALLVAERLGLVLVDDQRLSSRARFLRLGDCSRSSAGAGTIVVGPNERFERVQWAVAHEIGESVAHRVFERLGTRPQTAPPNAREWVANHLAHCLLLPRRWFATDGRELEWDLLALKERYGTASHELIARRMLEMRPPILITIFDRGRTTWRRGNVSRRPRLLPQEMEAWQRAHASGLPNDAFLDPATTGLERVRCWPVHEPDWKREILRSDAAEF